jgi:N-acyl-D-glutamate deacylase
MRLHLLTIASLAMFGLPAALLAQAQDYDIAINGGRVIDPETKLDAVRNIGIKDGKVVSVSEKPLTAKMTIDATGLIVAPGFVDLHAHGQSIAADRMQAFDGVTTTLELESGNIHPDAWYKTQAKSGRVLNYGASVAWLATRQAAMRPFGTKGADPGVKGSNKVATEEQLKQILEALEQGLKEGAIGIGCPAGYAPDHGYKEMLAVHQLAARYKVPTFTHVRSTSASFDGPVQAYGELISYSVATGAHVHICHLNSTSGRDIALAARLIQDSQKRGAKITVEAYPYGAGSTSIGSVVYSPEVLKRQGVAFSDLEYQGKPLTQETYEKLRKESPGATVISHYFRLPRDQEFLDQSVLFPGGIIASDAVQWIDTQSKAYIRGEVWPLPATAFSHPRSASTFTKFLVEYVRDANKETLLEGIARCAYRPAKILEDSTPAFKNKGRIQPGRDADIIVFDLAGLKIRATFAEPNQHTLGVKHVFVNGVAVIADGELDTKAFPGKAVKR